MTIPWNKLFLYRGSSIWSASWLQSSARGIYIALGLLAAGVLLYLDHRQEDRQLATGLLFQTAADGDVRRARRCVAEGIDPNVPDATDNTPLYYACAGNRIEVAKVLLQAGADVRHRNHVGVSAVQIAAQRGSDLIRCLLDYGADPDECDRFGTRPLMVAALSGNCPAIQLLAERGAQLDATNHRGESALFFAACGSDDGASAILLLRLGASLQVINRNGETALHDAARHGSWICFRLLLDAGADPSCPDNKDVTPDSLAVERDRTEGDTAIRWPPGAWHDYQRER